MRARRSVRGTRLLLMLLITPVPLAAQLPQPNPTLSRLRQGFWFSGGLGYGSASNGNFARMGGWSGGLAGGWTLSQKVQLGLGAAGWTKSGPGEGGGRLTINIATLDARIRFYPDRAFRFFFTGGLGLGIMRFADEHRGFNHFGRGILLGAGYDIAIGPQVSVTPFANFYDVQTSDPRANVGQIGLALTVY